jgi:hypothetical protein
MHTTLFRVTRYVSRVTLFIKKGLPMPALNKQTLINLLIDSPLREAIKINLIDIINNTADTDLEKTYSTITKELEIYQKATERRLKLAGETIAQLAGTSPQPPSPTSPQPTTTNASAPTALPPLPPLPTQPTNFSEGQAVPLAEPAGQSGAVPLAEPAGQSGVEVPKATTSDAEVPTAPLESPKLDLPPLPSMPSFPTPPAVNNNPDTTATATPPTLPQPEATNASEPTPAPEPSLEGDEAALQEIQKELDALKNSATIDTNPTPSEPEPQASPEPSPQA